MKIRCEICMTPTPEELLVECQHCGNPICPICIDTDESGDPICQWCLSDAWEDINY